MVTSYYLHFGLEMIRLSWSRNHTSYTRKGCFADAWEAQSFARNSVIERSSMKNLPKIALALNTQLKCKAESQRIWMDDSEIL